MELVPPNSVQPMKLRASEKPIATPGTLFSRLPATAAATALTVASIVALSVVVTQTLPLPLAVILDAEA